MTPYQKTAKLRYEYNKYRTFMQQFERTISWLQTANKHWQSGLFTVAVLHFPVRFFYSPLIVVLNLPVLWMRFGPLISGPAFSVEIVRR